MNMYTENRIQPPSLIMNEKTLADYLGQTEYAVRQLRTKCGLPCLPRNGRHEIQYYWPAVDEYFRQQSKPFCYDMKQVKKTDYGAEVDMDIVQPEPMEPVGIVKQCQYKKMEPV